jgi:hypothetical protein
MAYARGTFLLLVLGTVPAGAIELSIVGNGRLEENSVKLGLSETASLSIRMEMGEDDGNVWAWLVRFDATPLQDSSTDGYEIVDRKFTLTNNNGITWERPLPWDGDPNIESFYSNAIDLLGPGTDGPWRGAADNLFIHGTRIGEYDLYFENRATSDHSPPVPGPVLLDRDNIMHFYYRNLDLPGFLHFRNGWLDEATGFDVPFRVGVVPEPGAFLMLLIGGVLISSRRGGVEGGHDDRAQR